MYLPALFKKKSNILIIIAKAICIDFRKRVKKNHKKTIASMPRNIAVNIWCIFSVHKYMYVYIFLCMYTHGNICMYFVVHAAFQLAFSIYVLLLVFKIIALFRYNLHIIKLTLLNCTVHWFSVYPWNCATIATNSRTFPSSQKKPCTH